MTEQQLDLFSDAGARVALPLPSATAPLVPVADMDDAALVAAIPGASLADCAVLADESARRRLAAAVPALEALCRRFAGFGVAHKVAEQVAALAALAAIGGPAAAQSVSRLIGCSIVQGPGLVEALNAAVRLGSRLPDDVLQPLLTHPDSAIRAGACRCARSSPDLAALLVERLDDIDRAVTRAAACSLGHMGRSEARAALTRLLRDNPSEDVIDAVSSVADHDCVVLLGRIARSMPGLAAAAREALDCSDHPLAAGMAAKVRSRQRQ